jgi:CDP-diacylglycerol--serine O-phosphatidyltransferase
MQFKKHIPNIITLLNLFCGCIAIIFVTQKNFQLAFFFVSLGIFLDFFDGFFARLLQVSSPLGLQLDSLADMVTSGLVPGFTMFVMLANFDIETPEIFPYLGFVITLGACYRLANFNIDTRQTDSFIGLPTPANALLILSLPLILEEDNYHFISELLTSTWFLLLLTALSTFMMNAEIALFSLKIKKLNFKDNSLQIAFLSLSILLLFFFHFLGVALVILMYVLLSFIQNNLIRTLKKK